MGSSPPVLDGLSELELDAIVSQLRTDKNLTIAPVPAATEHLGAVTEQRLRLTSSGRLSVPESEAARDEAARQAWHIALGERVVGPLQISALRGHWERGELGPDSLCWRKGFEEWQRVCQVPGLAECLAPRTSMAPSSAEELVPDPSADVPDFQLKGAEALRILAEEIPPPLPSRLPEPPPPPVLDEEPVTAPVLEPEPPTVPDAMAAQAAVGAHPTVNAPPATRLEVRVRGGAWLVFSGGIVGGMLVALVVWLLGLTASLGLSSRGAPAQEAVTPATAGSPVPVALKPEAPAASGSLHAPAIGTLPGLGNAAASLKPTPVPAAVSKPSIAKSEPMAAPKPVALPTPRRVTFEDPAMAKQAKAEVSTPSSRSGPERVASAQQAAEEDDSEDLGLDKEFERELSDPAKRAVPMKRTVYIPPDPKPLAAPSALSQSDIFSVVVSNKGDITECVSAQKLQSEQGTRRVVVRWTILPSGKVTDVDTETRSYQGTPLALCLEGKIREWTFPKHQQEGGPVRFPFVF